jgi:acylphosphatase
MAGGEPRAVRLRLSGRVQGVGFRFFTLRLGRRRGLRGWVRNAPDGSVEIEVTGAAEELRAFKEELRQGPSAARVDRIAEEELPEPPDRETFDIEY